MRTQKKGFTLIELLVVIAIIAILAAILFPVFAQARAKARQVVCMNNEKQLGTAMLMYAQDYDERWLDYFPGFNRNSPTGTCYNYQGNCGGPHQPVWITPRNNPYASDYILKPYVKNDTIQFCPTLHQDTVKYTDGFSTPVSGKFPNYAMNELWANGANSPYSTPPTPDEPNDAYHDTRYLPPDFSFSGGQYAEPGQWWATGPFGRLSAQFAQSASLITIWEHNNLAILCNTWSTKHNQIPDHWDASHHGGFNAAFADGHVKRMTLGTMRNQYVCYWQLPE